MAELAKLPGVGRKTAQRFALHVLKAPPSDVEALIRALGDVREKIRLCNVCFNFSEGELCGVCSDPRREQTVVCVVEEAVNVLAHLFGKAPSITTLCVGPVTTSWVR